MTFQQTRLCTLTIHVVLIFIIFACGNPTNDRAISLDELEATQTEDVNEWQKHTSQRDRLSAAELIQLADCRDLPCVQAFMKNLSRDFVHASSGEYAALHRSLVIDTAGAELTMPMSTFYVDVNPQASWKAAHTVHSKAQADSLYEEFVKLGFTFAEEGRFLGTNTQRRYVSANYPGMALYVTASFNPWGRKGLYNNSVTWPCYTFEVYRDEYVQNRSASFAPI